MNLARTTAVVLAASALWIPVGALTVPADDPGGDSMIIQVQVPQRSDVPASPAPTEPTRTPPATTIPDAAHPRPESLPATGAEVAVLGAALALAAVVTGAVVRARRRSRA